MGFCSHTRICFVVAWRDPDLKPLRWRHNERDSVSNDQPYDCLLNRLFRRRSKKTYKLRVTGLCVGNSPGPVNTPHKGPVTRKMFPFDDVIMRGQFHHTTMISIGTRKSYPVPYLWSSTILNFIICHQLQVKAFFLVVGLITRVNYVCPPRAGAWTGTCKWTQYSCQEDLIISCHFTLFPNFRVLPNRHRGCGMIAPSQVKQVQRMIIHDDVIKWKHFSRYWPFVRGRQCQWRGALIFSLICAWINGWINNREVGDLRPNRAHYDISVMCHPMCTSAV